jgi:lyso-ornithine lipid O-acyltransferase
MSAVVADRPAPIGAMTAARLLSLIVALAAFIIAFGLARRTAQRFQFRLGRDIPVYFQRILCAGLGVKVRRHGSLSSAPKLLIVANHVSWLDIPVLGSLGPMSFLAKKEIGDHPVGRALVAMQGVVYVDRRRRSAIPAVNARIAEAMSAGAVVLFPEATTGNGNRLLRFRSSHFEAVRLVARSDDEGPAIIQPIYIDYSRLAGLPLARCERPRVAWYGDMAFLPHFLRYCRSGGVTCDVYFGQPIPIPPDMDRKTAARLSEDAVRELASRGRYDRGLFSPRRKAPK